MTQPQANEPKSVVFLCNTNRGKSQMAAAIAEQRAPEWAVYSAGTTVTAETAGQRANAEAAASLKKIGADMEGRTNKPVDGDAVRSADYVVVVGGAEFDMPSDASGEFIRWDIVDPSKRGLEGEERMDALRDDIAARVDELVQNSFQA